MTEQKIENERQQHTVIVLDREAITACTECGLQFGGRPGVNALTALFAAEHQAMLEQEAAVAA